MTISDRNWKGIGQHYVLAIIGGVILGISFPPSPLYSLAYIAFFPLFWLYEHEHRIGYRLWYTYVFLFIFHCITLYWVGGFVVGKDPWMMIAGGALLVLHPLFYLPFLWLAFLVQKKSGRVLWYVAFVSFWISFEYLHSLSEYAFPWLTLGNSQAYDINRIQIAEFTSVYGLSFIILLFNILSFELTRNLLLTPSKTSRRQNFLLASVLVLIYALPYMYGAVRIKTIQPEFRPEITLGVVQPNIDPWQKWEANSTIVTPEQQIDKHLQYTKTLAKASPDLIIWPETAIPIHLFLPRYSVLRTNLLHTFDSLKVNVVAGLPTHQIFSTQDAPPTAEKIGDGEFFVESYNSLVLFEKNGTIGPVYKKIVLVPFAERIPYPEVFRFLIEPLKWNVGISSWGKGRDTIVYQLYSATSERVQFAGLICYESVFPQYVREMVKRGANFLIIITNDSWWGRTSGAYQHVAYASFRAIETHRWIVQAANGGISAIIDPTGRVRYQTNLYETAAFLSRIVPEYDSTFYVVHGDIFAQSFVVVAAIVILYWIVTSLNKRKVEDEIH